MNEQRPDNINAPEVKDMNGVLIKEWDTVRCLAFDLRNKTGDIYHSVPDEICKVSRRRPGSRYHTYPDELFAVRQHGAWNPPILEGARIVVI